MPATRSRRPNEETASDLARLRTERHANADLAPALRDGVTEDAICANGREEQRDASDDSRKHGRRTAPDEALRDARLHGPDVIDRQLRIGRAHEFSQRVGKRFRCWLVRVTTKMLPVSR